MWRKWYYRNDLLICFQLTMCCENLFISKTKTFLLHREWTAAPLWLSNDTSWQSPGLLTITSHFKQHRRKHPWTCIIPQLFTFLKTPSIWNVYTKVYTFIKTFRACGQCAFQKCFYFLPHQCMKITFPLTFAKCKSVNQEKKQGLLFSWDAFPPWLKKL